MTTRKDHDDLIQFMGTFKSLRADIDDDPSGLEALAADDEGLKKKCLATNWAAMMLEMAERRHRQIFSAPVDPKFIEAWRDYENRYSAPLAGIFLSDLGWTESPSSQSEDDPFEIRRDNAQWSARERANAIQGAIDFAEEQAEQDWRDFPEGFAESLDRASRNGSACHQRQDSS